MVSSQERRAAVVLWINRLSSEGKCGSIAGFVPPSVHIAFHLLVLPGRRGVGCLLGEPSRQRPVLPPAAPPRRSAMCRPAPTRPWYIRVWVRNIETCKNNSSKTKLYCRVLASANKLSDPKPGHTTGGSGLGITRRDGGAGRGRAGRDADGSVRPDPEITVALIPQTIEEYPPGLAPGSTNKGNPM